MYRDLPLIQTKLAPPLLRKVVRRERLLEVLGPDPGVKVYLISAEPGYGKTTLLAMLARESSVPVVWLRLDPLDADPVLFLRYLIAGTKKTIPGFGDKTISRLQQAGPVAYQERQAVWRVFLAELSEWATEGLLIVLDDFHLVDGNAELRDLIKDLIELAPDNVHLYLGSRDKLQLPLGRLRSKGQVASLGREDLRFTSGEIHNYLEKVGGFSLDEAEVLGSETDGWIAGLVLLSQAFPAGTAADGSNQRPALSSLRGEKEIHDFLSQEVFEQLSPELQALLENTSLLEVVIPALVDQVLEVDGSETLLEEAEERRLFVFRLDDAEGSFRYHPLLRRFLSDRLEKRLGKGVTGLHAAWAKAFENEGDLLTALEHYFDAGERESAVRLVETLADEYLGSGHAETILHWLDRIELDGDTRLALVRTRTLHHMGRLEEAIKAGRRALSAAETAGGPERRYGALSSLGESLMAAGQWEEGTALLESALDVAGNPKEQVAALTLLGCSNLARCRWEEASGQYHQVLALKDGLEILDEARIYGLLGVVDWWQGNFRQAGRLMGQAVELLRGTSHWMMLARQMNNLAFCLCAQARYDEAKRINQQALELCSEHYLVQEEGSALDNLGHLQAASGDFESATGSYEAGLEIFRRSKDAPEQLFALHHLAACRRRSGDLEGALHDQRRAASLAGRVGMPYAKALASLNLGVVFTDMGRYEEAEPHLSRARGIAEGVGLGYLCFRLDFLKAREAMRTGRTEPALDDMRDCLARARRKQYHHFLIQEGKMDLSLLVKAFEAGIERAYLGFILERIGRSALSALPDLLRTADNIQQQAVLRVLARLPVTDLSDTLRPLLREADAETKKLAQRLLDSSPESADRRYDLLTARELEIACLAAEGSSNREIAAKLYLSEGTVKTHLNRVFHKLQIQKRSQLAFELREILDGGVEATDAARPDARPS